MSRLRLRLRHRAGEFALDVDLDLPAGIVGICGPSGAGKTSLLRAVAGLTKDVVGEVRIGDAVWLDARRTLPAHERAVGMVFQDACLFPHLTVRGNLEFGARRLPGGEAAAALGDIDALAERLGITALLARRPAHLSGGEAQRVGIARALALRPQLLLLDEPLAALDPARREALLPWLAGTIRTAGIPALYVSHSPDELARVADHLVVMGQGRVTAHGPLGDLLTRLDLPLAHTRDAESLLEAVVAEYDAQWALARVAFAGGSLWVPMPTAEIGRRVRLRLRAGDVSLALAAHADTSIVNVLPARVLALADSGPSQVLARLAVGETVLLSRITRRSAVALGLAPGIDLYVQIKGVAILGEG